MKRHFLLPIAALMAAAIVIAGCKKDENNPEPQPEPNKEEQKNEPKIQYDSSEVISLLNRNQYLFFEDAKHSPKSGDTACRCFSYPLSIYSRQKLYEPIEIKVLDTLTYTYRFQTANCTIADASGENLALDFTPESSTYQLDIPHKDLKPNTEYTVTLTVTLAQLINGEWKQVFYKGSTIDAVCKVTFKTGSQSEGVLDARDILYQYPIDRQFNYMPNEYKQGYIMLSYNYSQLFEGINDTDKKIVISAINDEDFSEQTVNYTTKPNNEVKKQEYEINYSLESISFNPNKMYSFEFFAGENKIYQMYFQTSRYKTLSEKLKDYQDVFDGTWHTSQAKYIRCNLEMDEFFDMFEYPHVFISSDNSGKGIIVETLIKIELDTDNCEWYKNTFKEMYDQYTYDDLKNFESRTDFKCPPSDAVTIFNALMTMPVPLSDEAIQNGCTEPLPGIGNIGVYWLHYMSEDARLLNYPIDAEKVKYTYGEYPIFVCFKLPGKDIVTTREKHTFTYKSLVSE